MESTPSIPTGFASEMQDMTSTEISITTEYPPYPFKIRYTLAICLAVVCTIGLFGNGLVMLSVIFSRKLQTKTNIFVFTLAVADFMTCCGMPFSVVSFLHDELPYPHPLCTLGACLIWVGVNSSCLNLAYIAYNRFILITRSRTSYERIFNKFVVTGMLCFAWIFPFLLYIVPVFILLEGIGYTARFHVCMTDYFAYLGVLCQLPAAIVIVLCYIKIYRHIRSHATGLRSHSIKERPETSSSSQAADSAEYKRHTSKINLTKAPPMTLVIAKDSREGSVARNIRYPYPEQKQPTKVHLFFTGELVNLTKAPPMTPIIDKNGRKSSVARSISTRQVQVTKNMFFVVCGYYICIMPYMVVTVFTDIMADHIWAIALPWTTSFMLLNSCVNFVIYSFNHPQFNIVFRKILICRWSEIPQPSSFLQRILSIGKKY